MIDRTCAELHREGHRSGLSELVAVETQCEAGVPAWVVHAEKGDGGLTDEERQTLEACPHVRLVTIPGHVFFLPNEIPERIAAGVAAGGLVLACLLTLGPDPTFFGMRAMYQAPYGWLTRLPGFDGLRVPARFWMMCLACLTVLVAFAINRLSGRTRRIVVIIGAIGLVLDGWPKEFSVRAEPASPQATDAIVNPAVPMMKVRLRPN